MKKSVVAVIGGQILYDPVTGFRTSTLEDFDNPYGLFADSLRTDAASVLYFGSRPWARVLVIGGITPLHRTMPDAPTLSSVMRKELESTGVPSSKIEEIPMPEAGGTFNQLVRLRDWRESVVDEDEIIVLASWWQMPRILAMVMFPEPLVALVSGWPPVRFACAEDVLIENEPLRWWAAIARAYRRPEMQECLRKEYNGARMLSTGEYKFPTRFPQR